MSATRRLAAIALTAVAVALFGVMAVASATDPPLPCSEFTCGGA